MKTIKEKIEYEIRYHEHKAEQNRKCALNKIEEIRSLCKEHMEADDKDWWSVISQIEWNIKDIRDMETRYQDTINEINYLKYLLEEGDE